MSNTFSREILVITRCVNNHRTHIKTYVLVTCSQWMSKTSHWVVNTQKPLGLPHRDEVDNGAFKNNR